MTEKFFSQHYLNHNCRRLEHLATLRLPIHGKKVVELGAGVGSLTGFFLDRGCQVTAIEGRKSNAAVFAAQYPDIDVRVMDLDCQVEADHLVNEAWDVTICYGLLYHLKNPRPLLEVIGRITRDFVVLETCVSDIGSDDINVCVENKEIATQSLTGHGCRPSRTWIFHQLKRFFPNVYTCRTQPSHEEFPVNWNEDQLKKISGLTRSVFVASMTALDSPDLYSGIIKQQSRV